MIELNIDFSTITKGHLFKNFNEKKIYVTKTLKKISDEADKQVLVGYVPEIQRGIKKIYKDVIDDFYSYPTMFPRNNALYNLMIITQEEGECKFWMDFLPERLTDRNGHPSDEAENGLYNLVFVKGYHGGTFGSSSHFGMIPVPRPRTLYDGKGKNLFGEDTRENIKQIKWVPAEQASISPLDDFIARLKDYEKECSEEYTKRFVKEFKKNIDKLKN